jgi:protein O-GlcNAc transferase
MENIYNETALTQEQINDVLSLYSSGRIEEAISEIKALNSNYPNVPLLFNILGACYQSLGHLDASIQMFKTAVSIKPDYAEAHFNLGIIQKKNNQLELAIQSYKRTISLAPSYAEAYNNLGNVYKIIGQNDDAINSYIKAIEIKPEFADAHNNLGIAFKAQGQIDIAVHHYETAAKISPNFYDVFFNLGNAYRDLKKRDKALISYERGYELKPSANYILGNILNTKAHLCEWSEWANQLYELQNKINDGQKVIGPFALMSLIDDPKILKKTSEIYSEDKFPRSDFLPSIVNHPLHKKIRLGYFSADFREHPVSTLTAELYEIHDRNQFEVHAFSYGPDTQDNMNLRIKNGVDYFHDVRSLSFKDTALLARSFEIDIAIDLGGFTKDARTGIFAMSAAPIQLSYIGYLGTMGSDYYDYLIADLILIPKENQKYYLEKIAYLPSFQVNDSKDLPPDKTMTLEDLGLSDRVFVFCCFNNTYKITPKTFDGWARILKSVEDSVLILYANNELSKVNLTKEIEQRGVAVERLIFGENLDRAEYLARYRVADLFLDTHPYNAGTTASDALKMGLPMLTMRGRSYQARMGASIVNAVNLPELITNSQEEYESLAIELATNQDKLKAIKEKLANNLATAPLYDTKLFTKNIESAYKQMYYRHHKGLEPDHINVEDLK